MNKQQKEEFYDWIDIKRTISLKDQDHGQSHAEKMIELTKKLFMNNHRIEEKSECDLLGAMKDLYSQDEVGCKRFIFNQKRFKPLDGTKTYELWIKRGKTARKYFGDELLDRLWKI